MQPNSLKYTHYCSQYVDYYYYFVLLLLTEPQLYMMISSFVSM